uniref:Suppressor of tumorigenicity 14 protein homolog n=1 Tax=Saccoglossus kowalevskii TaxID=10224 RepID=A0ABM0MKM5_SACKO|nr:PREDICTED: suppressor of tumorigenicity 14 protein homolog [Saccoglossus kowalevskii]
MDTALLTSSWLLHTANLQVRVGPLETQKERLKVMSGMLVHLVALVYTSLLVVTLAHGEADDVVVRSDDIDLSHRDVRAIGDCGGSFYSTTGAFSSPNYPNGYYNNDDLCTYTITVASGSSIQLTFTAFDTESYDHVYVYDGLSTYNSLLLDASGSFVPAPVLSSGNTLYVVFDSDSSVTHTGFYATYTTLDYESGFGSLNGVCGGSLTTDSGTLSSPNYPYSYSSYSDCYYRISVTSGENIQLTFSVFSTESTYDYVRVYDGSSTSSPLLGEFSGSSLPSMIVTTGSDLLLYFHSDSSVENTGFYASYTLGSGSVISLCEEGYITSLGGLLNSHDTYPSDYAAPVTCSATLQTFSPYTNVLVKFLDVDLYTTSDYSSSCPHSGDFKCDNYRCISKGLKCNGYDNCGDNSDEEMCDAVKIGAIIGGVIGGLLFVIIIIIICCCCCKKKSPTSPTSTSNTVTTHNATSVRARPLQTQPRPTVVAVSYNITTEPGVGYYPPPPPSYGQTGGYHNSGYESQPPPSYIPPPGGNDPAYPPPPMPTNPDLSTSGGNTFSESMYPPPTMVSPAGSNDPAYPPPPTYDAVNTSHT